MKIYTWMICSKVLKLSKVTVSVGELFLLQLLLFLITTNNVAITWKLRDFNWSIMRTSYNYILKFFYFIIVFLLLQLLLFQHFIQYKVLFQKLNFPNIVFINKYKLSKIKKYIWWKKFLLKKESWTNKKNF